MGTGSPGVGFPSFPVPEDEEGRRPGGAGGLQTEPLTAQAGGIWLVGPKECLRSVQLSIHSMGVLAAPTHCVSAWLVDTRGHCQGPHVPVRLCLPFGREGFKSSGRSWPACPIPHESVRDSPHTELTRRALLAQIPVLEM